MGSVTEKLVERLRDAAIDLRFTDYVDAKAVLTEAADEIERLRAYAMLLESGNIHDIYHFRDQTGVNWEAIHGVKP